MLAHQPLRQPTYMSSICKPLHPPCRSKGFVLIDGRKPARRRVLLPEAPAREGVHTLAPRIFVVALEPDVRRGTQVILPNELFA